ncbi:3-hydroxybutyryl-CoA dehydrogenase [Paenibacillus baekrokdamisoli]|uniref:3-hydroxybutyryl-CoA dehydrogenase n=1 Tax=Paenibacillus baekrokdamisoli TaxID=1712516 RepID=A0A3G9J063_9BACL|nr:3-hydroxyacyl-CoA dehydrogenase family protein [Paenibacillus baekrokdamisoli]MBB3073030.1 3-hydroxybutyryl-CoA dehydrogenase [Paenibacillus baekrokdamisoli]BBH21735.1 3-hydroxybutyryl-CoA dehydrogenase [Paenibacillus baekrokdamisoli]
MFNKIAVLGAGTMGRGIAQVFAQHGIFVVLYDPNANAIKAAKQALGDKQALGQKEWNLQYADNLTDAVKEADLIIETVSENLEIKRELYRLLTPLLKKDAIVVSNTSTYSLETLAQQQSFAKQMIITHFFNPAAIIPLVEIVQLAETEQEITERVIELLLRCGKVPVLLKKDIAGFIANRLQAAVMREACYLMESGVADASQIDTAMKEGPGMRWAINGPFEIADMGGLDVWEKVTGHLFPQLDPNLLSPESISNKVRLGELGVKSGKGFYEYGDASVRDTQSNEREQKLLQIVKLKENH